MKRLINPLVICFFLFCSLNLFAQTEEERILQFHSDIHILKNCRIHVSEHIRIVVQNERIRHGILRDLPLIYPYKGGTVSYDFKLLEVLRDGEYESFHVKNTSNGIHIYIGYQGVNLDTGVYEYTINYTINHAIGLFDNVDELSWNVNGTSWPFPVEQLSATIYWPQNARLKQYAAYTGFYGSKKTEYTARKLLSGISFKANRPLSAGENMTVSIGLEKNGLVYPSTAERLLYGIRSFILWIISAAGMLLLLSYNFFMWNKYGKDPQPGTIMPCYEPPADLSPAECAFIHQNGKNAPNNFSSMLLQLAVKGWVSLKLHTSDNGYSIEKLQGKSPLNSLEQLFFNALFARRSRFDLHYKQYDPIIYACNIHLNRKVEEFVAEEYFEQNNHLKWPPYLFPIAVLIGGIIAKTMLGGSFFIILISVLLMVLCNYFFGKIMSRPTLTGRKIMDEIAGFELYLRYAEKERIRLSNPPDLDFHHFKHLLPYAMAFGLAKEWAKHFSPAVYLQMRIEHPDWFPDVPETLTTWFAFESIQQIADSATVPHETTVSHARVSDNEEHFSGGDSYSGGGDFSSGDGFSGGGGGGGGGDGW